MITFVIYVKGRKDGEVYKSVIQRFLFAKEDHYEIEIYNEKSKNVMGKIQNISRSGTKIFFLDTDIDGLEVARQIRINGDFTSPVILLCSDKENLDVSKLNNILYLDIIEKNSSIVDLMAALKEAYRIATKYSVLTLSIFDELYRLPFDEICYIEKNSNCDSVTIYTMDDSYQNYISIKALTEKLKDDPRFYKSHRSCIINVFNVASYDKKNNTITFKNGMTTDLVARNRKRQLVDKLNEIAININE